MNIIEALKSGKKFRRQGKEFSPAGDYFHKSEVMADDWEIEKHKIVFLPRDLIFKAYAEIKRSNCGGYALPLSDLTVVEQ